MIVNLYGFACLEVWAMGKVTGRILFLHCNSHRYSSQSVPSVGFFALYFILGSSNFNPDELSPFC